MRDWDTARDRCVVTLRGVRIGRWSIRARLVHCNTHPARRSGAATAREREECSATAAAEDVAVAADGLCMGTRRTRWDRTDRGTDDHTDSHSHMSARALVGAAPASAAAARVHGSGAMPVRGDCRCGHDSRLLH